MLQHEQRYIRNYPREFSAVENSSQKRSKYHRIGADGQLYLDLNAIQQDIDPIEECDCKNCPKEGCLRRKKNYDPALHVGGADPYTEAISRGLAGAGQLAQAFKANPDVSAMRNKLKEAKAQCPKPPLIRLSKAAKQKKIDYDACVAKAIKDERDFELAIINANKAVPEAAARIGASTPASDVGTNKALYWAIGIGAFVLILIVVIIIIAMRMMKNKMQSKKE